MGKEAVVPTTAVVPAEAARPTSASDGGGGGAWERNGRMAPKEMYTGEPLTAKELAARRIFGCLGFRNVPREKRASFSNSGDPGVFIGYDDSDPQTYLIYHPQTHLVVISADSPRSTFGVTEKSRIDQTSRWSTRLQTPSLGLTNGSVSR